MKTGIELIAEERRRQINVEGWTPEHDAGHNKEELAMAAASYAMPTWLRIDSYWPFEPQWFKPTPNDRIRELVKAGALIIAEIERLQITNISNKQTNGCPFDEKL